MCTIQICVHCPEQESELLFDEVENAELAIEDLISRALLELFGTVFVEGVTITPKCHSARLSEIFPELRSLFDPPQ